MILPPPIVIARTADEPGTTPRPWTSYLTPASTWRRDEVPVTIAFAGELPAIKEDLRALLDVSGRAWSLPACTRAGFVAAPNRAATGGEGENGKNDVIVHASEWPAPLATGAAGHTVLYVLGDRIVEADIHLNARDFSFVVGAVPGKVDLQSLLVHELGHVLGIGHSAEARATMNAGLLSGIAARSLERDDREAACALYPGTSTGGCGTNPCPTPFRCIGLTCERENERAVDGAECAPATEVRRCDGAGDIARCVTSSVGERCARPCTDDSVCGVGLRCVSIASNDAVCLPDGATVDAGVTPDAGNDAGVPMTGGSDDRGCGCEAPRSPARSPVGTLLALVLLAARRRSAST